MNLKKNTVSKPNLSACGKTMETRGRKSKSSVLQKKQNVYDPTLIESKWQEIWEKEKMYSPDLDRAKKQFYNLMMFPYPSAEGMHVGNMYAFTGSDVYGRFQGMQGNNVFEPIGLDGFGIHSENYALKVGRHPLEQAKISKKNYYKQLRAIGNGFDWTKAVETYKPEYYKWTQWLFIQLFKAGLAYRKKAPVNFCPSCKTVLADEQVENGLCERCSSAVEKRDLEQWFFKITKYADRLLSNIDKLDWSEKVKIAQRQWIGKSEGVLIKFKIDDLRFKNQNVEVFTTRPDTLFGATFLALSPEHSLIASILDGKLEAPRPGLAKLRSYVEELKGKTERERGEGKEKTGAFVGLYVINPVDGERIPVWIADYVLMSYGTGAIMAVPAHDQRDFEFANKYNLPIKQVISSVSSIVFVHGAPRGPESMINLSKNSKAKYWMLSNKEELRKLGYEVYIPLVPTPWAPKYQEWKEEFEKCPIDESSIVVATSCGGSFVVRWLSETKRKIGKIILVAPAKQAADGKDERLEALRKFYDYDIDPNIKNYVRGAVVITSNDEERHLRSADLFEKALNAKRIRIEGKKHFIAEELPEIIGLVTNLSCAYIGEGKVINSGEWNGWKIPGSIGKVVGWLEEKGLGKKETNFHLRDWLISRQRYWGPPIPLVFCENCAVKIKNQKSKIKNEEEFNKGEIENPGWIAIEEKDLPVELPFIKDYKPLGIHSTSSGQAVVAPLASHPEFYKTTCPKCGGKAKRETDVSDTFLDSSWYFLRYVSTDIDNTAFDAKRVKKWLPVNMYIGGAEHSVLHLLYSRFVTMALKELGFIDFEEPFAKFRAHGLIVKDSAKMSKSKGNVVIPDEYIKKFGADTLRTYLMFMGPFSQGGDFRDAGVEGMYRFLRRVWNLVQKSTCDPATQKQLSIFNESLQMMHKTIKKVTEDMESLSYNTAIAGLMEWYNFLSSQKSISKKEAEVFLKLLSPFAPYVSEELYQLLNSIQAKSKTKNKFSSVHLSSWPEYDSKFLAKEEATIAIQINGKLRGNIVVRSSKLKFQGYIEEIARKEQNVIRHLKNREVRKTIYVEGKIINFVV